MKEHDSILDDEHSKRAVTACFSGHRPDRLPCYGSEEFEMMVELLRAKIHHVYDKHGIRHFITGMAKGWDVLCGEMVLSVRENSRQGLELECAVPFLGHRELIPKGADKTTYTSESYHPGVYHVRNKYMVDNSSVSICYWDGTRKGGTAWTANYAKEQGLIIYNIYDAVQEWKLRSDKS